MAGGGFVDGETICVVGEGGSVFYLDVPESKPTDDGVETNYAREIFDAKFAKGSLRLADAQQEAELREREGLPKLSAKPAAKPAQEK